MIHTHNNLHLVKYIIPSKIFSTPRKVDGVLVSAPALVAVDVLVGICDVQEEIFLVMFLKQQMIVKLPAERQSMAEAYLVKVSHGCTCRWNHIVNEKE